MYNLPQTIEFFLSNAVVKTVTLFPMVFHRLCNLTIDLPILTPVDIVFRKCPPQLGPQLGSYEVKETLKIFLKQELCIF